MKIGTTEENEWLRYWLEGMNFTVSYSIENAECYRGGQKKITVLVFQVDVAEMEYMNSVKIANLT